MLKLVVGSERVWMSCLLIINRTVRSGGAFIEVAVDLIGINKHSTP